MQIQETEEKQKEVDAKLKYGTINKTSFLFFSFLFFSPSILLNIKMSFLTHAQQQHSHIHFIHLFVINSLSARYATHMCLTYFIFRILEIKTLKQL